MCTDNDVKYDNNYNINYHVNTIKKTRITNIVIIVQDLTTNPLSG